MGQSNPLLCAASLSVAQRPSHPMGIRAAQSRPRWRTRRSHRSLFEISSESELLMLQFWMVLRYLREGRRFLSPNILLAVIGIALGVAALVISMGVVSGYETTLKNTLIG